MMNLNLLDLVIIGTTILSAIIGLFRGMAKEVITLVTWVVAAIVARQYGLAVGDYFGNISTELVRHLIGGFILFVGILIIGGVINFLIGKFVKVSGFVVLDKMLGAVFGVIRSLLAIVIVLLVFPFLVDMFVKEKIWQESTLMPQFQQLANYLQNNLPKNWQPEKIKLPEIVPVEQGKLLEQIVPEKKHAS